MVPLLFTALTSAVLAVSITWLLARSSGRRALAESQAAVAGDVGAARARLDELQRRTLELVTELDRSRQAQEQVERELASARETQARLETALEHERAGAQEKLALIEQARESLKEAFSALSADALKHNNESFLQLARTSLDQAQQAATTDLQARQKEISTIVEPLKDTLGKLGTHLQQVDRERAETNRALSVQLQAVADTQERLRRETETLVRALKHPNQRGRWGEVQLRNVVERAGMVAYCDFVEKDFSQDSDGRRLTPDMNVRLPNGASIIIDSKVPIDAYLLAAEAPDEQAREVLLRDHTRQVRDHIKALGAKSYWARFDPAPEFVVMFLPAEPLFSVAFQQDATLFEYAVEQRVIPASPLTLVALLRTVASAWQQQRLAENAEQIQSMGRELYERLSTMAEHVANVGEHLQKAGAAYDQFVGSLDSRVLASARRFRDLGVSAAKELPDVAPIHLAVREPNAAELRAPIQESLIEAELVTPAADTDLT